ncbi:MAG: response regulator transcription factor [Ardenticatenaceae bacterium]|nr:response regulator transcription factor [Ardenticatenaceae bacterium]
MCAIKILLVDDDEFTRMGLCLYLQEQGYTVSEAGDAAVARVLVAEQRPLVAIIDIEIPETKTSNNARQNNVGVELAVWLKQHYPTLGVVLFSAYEDRGQELFKLVQQGIRGIGYQLKGSRPSKLLQAVQGVMKGQVMIDSEVTQLRRAAAELLERLPPTEQYWVKQAVDALTHLTPREMEVAQQVALGHTVKGIAEVLVMAPKTAENYIGRIYHKLGLNQMHLEAPHLRQVTVLAQACLVYDLSLTSKA